MRNNIVVLMTVLMSFAFICPAIANIRNVQENHQFVYTIIDTSGLHVPGQAPTVKIRRASDGYWLDFSDNTFKTSGWTNKTTPLSENATDGFYTYTFDPPASETGSQQYLFCVDNNDATYADHQCELVSYESGSSAAGIAAAVWDEALSGHSTAGTIGKTISDIKDSTDGDKEGGVYTGIENTIRSSR